MHRQCPNPDCQRNQAYLSSGEEYFHTVGIEMPWVYDGVVMWECPFCGFKWPRHEVWGLLDSRHRKSYYAGEEQK